MSNYGILKHLWGWLAAWAAINFFLLRIGATEPKWPWVPEMFFFGCIGFLLLWNVCRAGDKRKPK